MATPAGTLGGTVVVVLGLLAIGANVFGDETPSSAPVPSIATAGAPGAVLRREGLSRQPLAAAGQPSAEPAGQVARAEELVRATGLPPSWLKSHGFTSIQDLERLHALLDGHANFRKPPRQALAMTPPGWAREGGSGATRVAAGESYLQTQLDAAMLGAADGVLVRWRRIDGGNVMELSAQPRPADPAEPLQLWMYQTGGWNPGSYRLEVISANPALELLAASDFEVAAPGGTVTALSSPVR